MGQKLGYARVSTAEQVVDLQIDALTAAGCATIYQEAASGRKGPADRPELSYCLKALRPGDTLVVWRLDRLGRSMKDLLSIVTDLQVRGVHFESVTERIETGTPAGKLMFHVLASLAEFERNLLRERVMAGLAAGRARGRATGRKKLLDDRAIAEITALLRDPKITVGQVAERYKVSRQTIYRRVGVVRPER